MIDSKNLFWSETKRKQWRSLLAPLPDAYLSERYDLLLRILPFMKKGIALNNEERRKLLDFWIEYARFSRYLSYHRDKKIVNILLNKLKEPDVLYPNKDSIIFELEDRISHFTDSLNV